jgi:hypothetical protein
MMNARNVKAALLWLIAPVMCAAPAAHGAMYGWTDSGGAATYSNQPPPEPDKVRDLKMLEGYSTAAPTQSRQAQAIDEKSIPTTPRTRPESSQTRAPAKFGESFRREPSRSSDSTALARPDVDNPSHEVPRLQARGRTEAVRDPCLVSSDPKCHQRNKDLYHPYFGYAPSVMQPASTFGTGATSATNGGSAIGGQVSRDAPPNGPRVDPALPLSTGAR